MLLLQYAMLCSIVESLQQLNTKTGTKSKGETKRETKEAKFPKLVVAAYENVTDVCTQQSAPTIEAMERSLVCAPLLAGRSM